MATAWVLNLDADLELARDGYAPTDRVLATMRPHVERARALLAPGDVLVGEGDVRGMPGRAWCPTPRALDLLVRAGANPEPHPSLAILRRVNSRAFCASLGQTLSGAVFATDEDAAIAAIRPNTRLKRNFGMAGRGHRVVDRVDEATRAYLRAAMREGGVQIEPNLKIEREFARHGFLAADGTLTLGVPVAQRCDAHGQWLSTEQTDSVPIDIEPVAEALRREGYFGPFGVDGFEFEGGVQPRSEINARYSMGYPVAFTRI